MFYYYQQLFTFDHIDKLYKDNSIIDARQGGLLLGPSHDDDGVYFLFEYQDGFRLYGEAEGFEYIINRDSAARHRNLVGQINNHDRDFFPNFSAYKFDNSILTIDATSPDKTLYKSKFIILDVRGGFAIINKYSTKIFLAEIDILNRQ
ncbi:MAG: hypothetical protein JSR09_09785 [Bacteroidetes bacterium]|nr:hypothetical protein [Bacteroidota bacterium]